MQNLIYMSAEKKKRLPQSKSDKRSFFLSIYHQLLTQSVQNIVV